MINSSKNRKLCPFLTEPFENCYCVKLDSQDIERAITLCSFNFELCEIYKEHNGNGDRKNGKAVRGTGSRNPKQPSGSVYQ
ncbi:MAG: hypothetical protein C4538_08690 [Nitrospiraceae bacterium]|nr:MAG: hypothetical protein C4538_08690 [Nitrospiraceae bacterium]